MLIAEMVVRTGSPRWPFWTTAVCACLLLLAACRDDGTSVGPPPRITIDPSQPVALYVGDTVAVRATIRNMPHTGVSYSSSASEIASVDMVTGVVTARAPGEATIVGVSVIDPRIYAEVDVSVLADLPASVSITEIRSGDGLLVDPARVAGTIGVTLDVTRGNARRMEVLLGEVAVCVQDYDVPIGSAPAAESEECTIDTAAFDAETAAPRFLNGAITLAARLVASGERTLAAAPEQPVTLANPATIAATVSGSRTAVDAAGNGWISGDVTVEAVPVRYDGGGAVRELVLEYRTPGGVDTTATDSGAPYTFALGSDGILAGVTDPDFRVVLSSTDDDGQPGPVGATSPLRYDGAAPQPGVLVPRDWIGAASRFFDSYSSEGESDAGVGRTHLRFYAGDPALPAGAIVAGGTPLVVGADLPQAALGAYRLVAQVCDGLENCVLLDGYRFGVDLTPPIVESVSIPDRTANPGSDLLIGARDDLSGFPERLLEVSVGLLDASPATPACGPTVEAIDLPGKLVGAECAPDTIANPVPVPRTSAGYYRYSIVAFDRAGNRSAPIDRSFLIDLEPPSIGPVTHSSPLVSGEQMSATAEVDDDVELLSVEFRLVYLASAEAGVVAIPFAPASLVGTPFDEVVSTRTSAVGTLPFVRTLTLGSAAAAARPTILVDSIRTTASDVAALTTSSSVPIDPSAYGGDTSTNDPYSRFSTAETTLDRTAVCTGACAAGDPTHVRVSARIEGESGTGRPFATIHFYRRSGGGLLTHIGSRPGTDATITNAGNRSSHLYTFDYTPPASLDGEFGIVAVGVNSRGNALATEIASAPRITFYRR